MRTLVMLAPLLAWSCAQDGEPGDRGPAGPAGPPGPASPAFVPTTYVLTVTEPSPAVAYCDEGDAVTGGACSAGVPEAVEEEGELVGVSCSAAAVEVTVEVFCMEAPDGKP